MPENVTFQNYGSHRLRNRFDKQGLSNTDLQTANPAKHFLDQSRTQETWKCKLNRKENRVKNLKKDLARTRNAYTNCSAGVILWMKQSDKKVSFDDPQNGGHFSCRKPVSHVGTSTVSDSEALIHLAYVQHMWQSKFVVILEGLTRWRIELCSKMQLAGNDYRCILICMFACWKKVLLCSFDSKNFLQILHHFSTPKWRLKNGPKMVPEFDPQNGVQKWHPKGGPNILLV